MPLWCKILDHSPVLSIPMQSQSCKQMAVPGRRPGRTEPFRESDKPKQFEHRNNWYASLENKIGNATIILNIKDPVELYLNPSCLNGYN